MFQYLIVNPVVTMASSRARSFRCRPTRRHRASGAFFRDHPLCRCLPVKMTGSPKFPHKPLPSRSCSFEDRIDRPKLALTLRPTRPRGREQPWLSRWTFEAQSHGLTACFLRFKAPGCPDAMQDSLRICAATLWWAILRTRWACNERFQLYVSCPLTFSSRHTLLSRACLAQSPLDPPAFFGIIPAP